VSNGDGVVPGEYPTPDGLKYWRNYVYVAHSPDFVLWEEGKPLSDGLLEYIQVGNVSHPLRDMRAAVQGQLSWQVLQYVSPIACYLM
jgi:hypothetical protein